MEIVAAVLAIIALIWSRGRSLEAWALLCLLYRPVVAFLSGAL